MMDEFLAAWRTQAKHSHSQQLKCKSMDGMDSYHKLSHGAVLAGAADDEVGVGAQALDNL